ncbi:MAG TPA: hypothetical protein V6D23_03890 [Candidatus Obscuribacterales bacterium]
MSQAAFDELTWDQLMELEAKQSEPLQLSDEDITRFNFRTILYKVDQENYKLSLMTTPGSGAEFLSDLLQEMMGEGYLDIIGDEYVLTTKAKQDLEAMASQYHSLVQHYDIFAHVDIDNSCFLEPGDDPNEEVMINGEAYPRFIDLRVGVMRFKGVSPFDMVFLNLLREGRIGGKPNWEFDLALGRQLYAEVEEIVNTAYTVKDLTGLGKTNDNGEIPGSDILRDVIMAGNQINQERQMALKAQKNYDMPEQRQQNVYQVEVIHEEPMFVEYHYDPFSYYNYYHDPFYVEPIWTHHHYRSWF